MEMCKVAFFICMLMLSSCVTVGPKDPTSGSSFVIQNVHYRTGNASGALLGSIGYLSGGGLLGGENSFDRKRMPDYNDLKLTYEGEVGHELKNKVSSDTLVNAEATIQKLIDTKAKIEGKILSDTERKVNYHLISITNTDDAVLSINADSTHRSLDLLKAGNDKSRIITKIIVAYGYAASKSLEMSAKLGLKLTTNDDVNSLSIGNLSASDAKIGVDTKTGIDLHSRINLSDGMIVGYSYDIPCWYKNSDGKIEIYTTVLDVYGTPQKCPSGEKDPSKL